MADPDSQFVEDQMDGTLGGPNRDTPMSPQSYFSILDPDAFEAYTAGSKEFNGKGFNAAIGSERLNKEMYVGSICRHSDDNLVLTMLQPRDSFRLTDTSVIFNQARYGAHFVIEELINTGIEGTVVKIDQGSERCLWISHSCSRIPVEALVIIDKDLDTIQPQYRIPQTGNVTVVNELALPKNGRVVLLQNSDVLRYTDLMSKSSQSPKEVVEGLRTLGICVDLKSTDAPISEA